MSEIPEIDYKDITEKYSEKLAQQQLQIFQLENIAESLRKQRDEARRNLADLQAAQSATAENAVEKPSA